MDVLDPREVEGHQNKVPIPATDEGGLSIAAVNRMIEGALRGVAARERAAKTK